MSLLKKLNILSKCKFTLKDFTLLKEARKMLEDNVGECLYNL